MQIVTVGSKYQIVIPKQIRQKVRGFRPGTKVMVQEAKGNAITIKTSQKKWSDESYGFMKQAWKGTNPAKEIEKMRDEWDQKV